MLKFMTFKRLEVRLLLKKKAVIKKNIYNTSKRLS